MKNIKRPKLKKIQAKPGDVIEVSGSGTNGSPVTIRAIGNYVRLLATVMILCAAVQAQTIPSHKAALNWTNSPDTANTNVYRTTGACSATVPATVPTGATLLTATPVTTATYTDSSVSSGTTYCWYVVAVNGSGQSTPIQIQGTIPLAPPSGLIVTVN